MAGVDPRSEAPATPSVVVSQEDRRGVAGWADAWRSMFVGLGITGKAVLSKNVTLRYPLEKYELSPRWRGALRLRGILGVVDVPIVRGPSIKYNAIIEDLYSNDRLAPCVGACPANVDARGQNYLVADNDPISAYELVRDRNILPGVLGRICHHPCEGACKRNYYDEPLAIRPLHRFVSEEYGKVREERIEKLPVTRPQKVAVIGSGPSGLAAAYDLMKLGYTVEVFEKEENPGGALYTGVPSYRLPREVLFAEVRDLQAMGLDIHYNTEIGRDIDLSHLKDDFDAVLMATGLQTSRLLPIPGTDAQGVRGALEFLKQANFHHEAGVKDKRVLVIGGGNVAVDVARCALRVGATEVSLACLEGDDEMPCHPWEIEEALDEGVIAMCGQGPESVLAEDGRVVGMRLRECLSVFDETGRFAPEYSDGLTDLSCDVVVFAIGQASELSAVVAGTDVELSDRGNLVVDGTLFTTSSYGVFACGEVVTGPGSAINSIATGHEAATTIHRFLTSKDLEKNRVPRPVPVYDRYESAVLDGVESSRHRAQMPMAKPEERSQDFRPVELGLTRAEASCEASRCLRCQSEVCVGCTFCARTCPDYAIQVERIDEPGGRCLTRYDLDMTKCCFCGLCAEQCPTNALEHTGQYELSFYHRELMTFDRGEMLRPPEGTRATGRDGISVPSCPSDGGEGL